MTVFTEGKHAGEFIVSGGEPDSCREEITVASGQNLVAGAVIGKVTKALAAAPIPSIVGTGTGAMSALTFGPDVQTGNYVITLLATSTTAAFSVVAPDGTALPNGAVGTAYASSHLNFLISNAGTMTTGDHYTVAVTAGGTPAVIGGTGTGTMSAITLGPNAQNGGYQVICRAIQTHGGDFEVLAPDGTSVGRFPMDTTTGAAASFTSSHINFTLTDATDFIKGNYFNVIVAKGSQKAKAWAPTAVDGTQHVAGILFDNVDASLSDLPGVSIYRNTVVNNNEITWGASVTSAQKLNGKAQLKALGITVSP